MPLNLRAENIYLPLQLWKRSGIALFQFFYPSSEMLRKPLNLFPNIGLDICEPLVLNHQRLNFDLRELCVLDQHLLIQRGLAIPNSLARPGLNANQFQTVRESVLFFFAIWFVPNQLKSRRHPGFSNLAFIVGGVLQQTILARVFFDKFLPIRAPQSLGRLVEPQSQPDL